MESLIYDNFKMGNSVEVFLKGSAFPIEAKFTKCSRGGVLLRSETGRKIVIPISEILMIRHAPYIAPKTQNNAPKDFMQGMQGKTFTPSNPNNFLNPNPEETPESATSNSSEVPADESTSTETPTVEEPDPNLFKLPTEKPQLKIIGSIELDSSDTKRKRFKEDPMTHYRRPQLADDFLDSELPAMGVLKSIGPVYGYIKVEGAPDIYVNRGEFLFFPDEEVVLEPGMPLTYSLGSNWKGQMAKCVHRPCTVGEQLDLIDKVINTDVRNARLLAGQLMEHFPESEEIADAVESYPQL